MEATDSELVGHLRRQFIDCLQLQLNGASTCALIDFPNHGNSGDSAIWRGERQALADIGCEVMYTADRHTFRIDELRRKCPDGPVLLHGGGNLGDLWPDHAAHREHVLGLLQDRHVIQLPQTVSLRSSGHLEALDRLAQKLRRLDVLVRDQVSFDRLARYPNLAGTICPDAAFAISDLKRNRTANVDVTRVLRNDHESTLDRHPAAMLGLTVNDSDWFATPSSSPWTRARASLAIRARDGIYRRMGPIAPDVIATGLARPFDALAARRVNKAVSILSGGRVAVTDRLHGHILCELLGIPHVLLDTKEQKVTNFRATFTMSSKLATQASDEREAFEIATQLVALNEQQSQR